ncbi:Zinc ribbon domain protein [Rubripirellula lacrimiformis]|uniref:Zinc ribbon domain protein n=1 Tax=Rubripirellula lacrimiformis TaxID=1930273 RepID=A0A517NGV2_9BACT|nr:zinc ribbon domain-containing protein [Rubripirellula lacrimiformis]QDT06361.1 Zinc ribbon domain protein [Rubripirellula lacrimiformis]
MPLYEYECKSCTQVVELLIRSAEDERSAKNAGMQCPECGKSDLERIFSVPASPAVKSGKSLPMAGGESCGAPRCCGGGC